MSLNAHGAWSIPEQSSEPALPGQAPLSRWTAHIESAAMPCAAAKSRSACAWASVVTSVLPG